MGQLIVVFGANGSGKSAYAEKLASRISQERFYLATMIPVNEENRQRIEKHRRQREAYHFHTIETPYVVGNAPITAGAVVLLEDVSNLFANGWFTKDYGTEQVAQDIGALQSRCRVLVAVTIAGLDSSAYSGETASYISGLNHLNELLCEKADAVICMKNQTAHVQKGAIALASEGVSDCHSDL